MKASKKLFGPFWPYGGPKKGQKRTFAKKETAVVSGFFHVFAFFAKTAWCIRKKRVFREKRWKRPKTAKNSQNGQNPENLVEKKAWKPSDAPLFTYPKRNSPKLTPKPPNQIDQVLMSLAIIPIILISTHHLHFILLHILHTLQAYSIFL